MKTKLLQCLIGAALCCTLTACDDYYESYRNNVTPHLTDTEVALMKSTREANSRKHNDNEMTELYWGFLQAYKVERSSQSEFFCDKKQALIFTEYAIAKKLRDNDFVLMTTIIKDTMGMSYDEVCELVKHAKSDINNPAPKIKEPETYQLTSQLYDELTDAVKHCKRAEYASISELKPNEPLSKEKYNSVANIIMQCKQFKLEQAIQGTTDGR